MAEPVAGVEHRIVGTAGHIDHGKTALVRALTGEETDRLPEEKKRGITIELGFASWRAADDLVVSVVDVPGHERFVRTMVAGAAGIDLVVLVVSADDGVMPQTREHLAVCELLGVQRGLVVITKRDLVDAEMQELVELDVADAVTGTFLEDAPVLACSATTGEGMDEVRAALLEAVRACPARGDEGPAFLPVDRVFTKSGFGTVVTGTLLSGALSAGDDVDVVPGPRDRPLTGLKARGLQVHGDATERARAGMRVAVNVRGTDHEATSRGDVVVGAGSRVPTRELHAQVRVLPDAPPIEERDELSLHVGTSDVLAKVTPLRSGSIAPGETACVRVVAERPVVAFPDQRLVLRKPGKHGQGTVAGGRVLDPHPSSGKGSFARWVDGAERLAKGDAGERLRALVADARAEGVSIGQLARRLPPGADVRGLVAAALEAGDLVELRGPEPRYAEAARATAVADRVLTRVRAFHDERPMLLGVSPGELASGLPPHERGLAEAAIAALQERGDVEVQGGVVKLPDHDPAASAGGGALARLEELWRRTGLTPPLDDEARKELDLPAPALKDGLAELKRRGTLRRVGDLHFHADALEGLRDTVRRHFENSDELTTADFKTLAGGVSRKFAIPLLEWLDGEGETRRDGDVRRRGN